MHRAHSIAGPFFHPRVARLGAAPPARAGHALSAPAEFAWMCAFAMLLALAYLFAGGAVD